jgi:uncharacterized membrane protein
MSHGALFLAVFLACAVEAVEATTIVLAVGTTRNWRSALIGAIAGLLALGVVIAALGPALTAVPLRSLRLVVGGLLLIFGLQWVKKAVLRASGLKALHNEPEIFDQEVAAHDIGLAAAAAVLAVVVVATAGIAVRAPLARVPENTMKFIVGVMLTSFGMFWGAEGAGARWPGSDASLPSIVVAVALFALGLVAVLRHGAPGRDGLGAGRHRRTPVS